MYDVAAVNTNDGDDHDDNRVQVPSENDPRVQITLDLATRSLYSEPTRNFGVFFSFGRFGLRSKMCRSISPHTRKFVWYSSGNDTNRREA